MNVELHDLLRLDDFKVSSELSISDLKEQLDKTVQLLEQCKVKGPKMRVGDLDVWLLGSFEIQRRTNFDNVYETSQH